LRLPSHILNINIFYKHGANETNQTALRRTSDTSSNKDDTSKDRRKDRTRVIKPFGKETNIHETSPAYTTYISPSFMLAHFGISGFPLMLSPIQPATLFPTADHTVTNPAQ
jgi:hypothetical protein